MTKIQNPQPEVKHQDKDMPLSEALRVLSRILDDLETALGTEPTI